MFKKALVSSAALVLFSQTALARQVEECGVAGYNSREDATCDPVYFSKRTAACGAPKYNAAADVRCPGGSRTTTNGPCVNGGFTYHGTRDVDYGECIDYNVDGEGSKPRKPSHETCGIHTVDYVSCTITITPTCQLPEFGLDPVEPYPECRHESHGLEKYGTCAKPEFGSIFNDCNIIMTKVEVNNFINNLKGNIELFGSMYLQNVSLGLKFQQNTLGLACFIQRWDGDPLTTDMVKDLKNEFVILSGGSVYDPSLAQNCAQSNIVTDVSCLDGDSSSLCKTQRVRLAANAWLVNNLTTTMSLIGDVVAKNDPQVATELQTLQNNLEAFLK